MCALYGFSSKRRGAAQALEAAETVSMTSLASHGSYICLQQSTPDGLEGRIPEPPREEVLDAEVAAQLQQPVLHDSPEGWVHMRILHSRLAGMVVPVSMKKTPGHWSIACLHPVQQALLAWLYL